MVVFFPEHSVYLDVFCSFPWWQQTVVDSLH